jgi:hypothetical protein
LSLVYPDLLKESDDIFATKRSFKQTTIESLPQLLPPRAASHTQVLTLKPLPSYSRRELWIFCGTMITTVMGPLIAMGGTLIHYSLTYGTELSASRAFAMLCLVTVLRFPIIQLGHIASAVAQCMVVVSRATKYLNDPDCARVEEFEGDSISDDGDGDHQNDKGNKEITGAGGDSIEIADVALEDSENGNHGKSKGVKFKRGKEGADLVRFCHASIAWPEKGGDAEGEDR